MTLAERLRNDGYHEGLLEAIELGISIKFENQRQTFMSLIQKIQDIEKLKKLSERLITHRN